MEILNLLLSKKPHIFVRKKHETIAYIKTNSERAYGKAQSRGGDANTVLEIVSRLLLYGVSVSLEQSVFMQEEK